MLWAATQGRPYGEMPQPVCRGGPLCPPIQGAAMSREGVEALPYGKAP